MDLKIINKTIPFSSVCSSSLFDIKTDIGHTKEGEFLEFYTANVTDLRIYKKRVDSSLLDALKKYSIISIKLDFNDKTCNSYNVFLGF